MYSPNGRKKKKKKKKKGSRGGVDAATIGEVRQDHMPPRFGDVVAGNQGSALAPKALNQLLRTTDFAMRSEVCVTH